MFSPSVPAQDARLGDDPLWKAVQEALDEGRPQTAIERLEPLIRRAAEAENHAESIRAVTLKLSLEMSTRPDEPAEKLKRMRVLIDESPEPMRPVMEAIQAGWMWEFFQQNRWRFAQRTAVADSDSPQVSPSDAQANAQPDAQANAQSDQPDADPDADPDSDVPAPLPGPDDDPVSWDLPRILRMIDGQFARSLRAAETLKSVPASDYKILLSDSNVPANHRPTMYDILVHHALEFYSAGEQAGSKAIDAFELLADSPIFASTDEFLRWQPTTTDVRAPLWVAVTLYQDLLRFHLDDADPTARLDADLGRLGFGDSHALGEEKSDRFRAALRRFADANANHPISTQALHWLAELARAEEDMVEAHRIASTGLARFPDSVGANRCFNLIQEIEAPEASVETERVWNAPWPTLEVRYRNVQQVHFRVVKLDVDEFITSGRWQPEQLDADRFRKLLQGPIVKAWSATLPATPDYQARIESLAAPQDLPPGPYLLFASHREDFADAQNQLSVTEIWVSDLALVTRTEQGRGVIGGWIFDAKTGEPRRGATVRGWQAAPRGGIVEIAAVTTDAQGEFRFPAGERNRLWLLASHRGHQISTAGFLHSSNRSPQRVRHEQTQFFTDRAIYRPGQTVRYKGICYSFDQTTDDYRTVGRQPLVVVFLDANGQEIERLTHATNEYGSFNGSFTAPRDRLTGQMTIRVESGPRGQTAVQVEEYKRPKFEVELAAPAVAAKLGEAVSLKGTATAYTGASIDQATVSWRVVREVRFPPWWFWRMWWLPPMAPERQEIARGTTTTNADGTFEISFVAKPDLSVDPESEPTFRYSVSADVTDGTGETRSNERAINLGYTALSATLTANEWLPSTKPVELAVRTTTLDGEGQQATGTIQVHALKQPEAVIRPRLSGGGYFPQPMPRGRSAGGRPGPTIAPGPAPSDPSNPNGWELGEVVTRADFKTDAAGNQTLPLELAPGIYRAVLTTRDRFGKEVTAILPLEVFDPATAWPVKVPQRLRIEKPSIEPGETFRAVWSSGYDAARVLVEIEHRGKIIQKVTSEPNKTHLLIELEVTEAMRGGFTIHTTMVRENRAYLESRRIDVPWSNQKLEIRWERFTSKLEPGASDKWAAVITGPGAEKAAAEMVATLYDASLDAFLPHSWMAGFGVFRQDQPTVSRGFENRTKTFSPWHYGWVRDARDVSWNYPRLDWPPSHLGQPVFFGRMMRRGGGGHEMMMADAMMPAPAAMAAESNFEGGVMLGMGGMGGGGMAEGEMAKSADRNAADKGGDAASPTAPPVDLTGVSVRTNLNETAFFFPHLTSGPDGSVRIEFAMPEALTRWNFLGFAHDAKLRAGLLRDSMVTSKDLMVQPNAPRFLREGDLIEFTVKVTNRSATRQTGSAALRFADARSGDSVDAELENTTGPQAFDIPVGQSKSLAWRIRVPDGLTLLTYQAVGSSGRVSDGEEGYLPVLPRRILVTESLPLPIRGPLTKSFDFTRLAASADSDSLRHQSLTVQMASNPAWYAVMSLPYLMEYPHGCSEQIFNRLYANSLARHIATSDPRIERVFAQWRGTPALDSPLTKNQDLKSVLLEETPWVRQADSESQARRNVGLLFDSNRLNDETSRALAQLTAQQLGDGRWPWFPGGPPNDFITLYITTGFGRLRHLGVAIDTAPAVRSLSRLDAWMTEIHREILKRRTKDSPPLEETVHLSPTIAMYLYGRSFFLADQPVAEEHSEALRFWLDQAKRHWLKLNSLQSQAHLAIALKRFGDAPTADKILVSLKERSTTNEEFGMFWARATDWHWWYRAPIETQAALIEAFDEVAGDAATVDACQVWLLKQRQTQDWKTTKATADAVYALLLRGTDRLASSKLVEITLGESKIQPEAVEAGTGFYEHRISGDRVTADMARVTVTKPEAGVAWGSVHWQYFEDIGKITSDTETPLKLTKELYVKENTDAGPVLRRVTEDGEAGQVKVGDELVVRLVLRVDRDMEYVHLKDHRGSGTEPVNVLSGYRYQDGLGYYESTRDAASHFFIDYLRPGTYVFEYSTRVQLRGEYQTGMANIECMYAPEFRSHSQSIPLVVRGE